jgi:hypothetical protein
MIAHHTKCYHFPLASFPFPPYNGRMNFHQPGRGNNPHKKRTEQAMIPQPQQPNQKITAHFTEDIIPRRGYALVECVFVGPDTNLFVPDSVTEKQQYSIIHNIGAPRITDFGFTIPNEWERGDFVYTIIDGPESRRIEMPNGKKFALVPLHYILGKFPVMPQDVLDSIAKQETLRAEGGVTTVDIPKAAP